jgi:hypothetical protein
MSEAKIWMCGIFPNFWIVGFISMEKKMFDRRKVARMLKFKAFTTPFFRYLVFPQQSNNPWGFR